jgi:hypothetical protein
VIFGFSTQKCVIIPVYRLLAENTFFEWMIIDSGPAEHFSDGMGRKNFFLGETQKKEKKDESR